MPIARVVRIKEPGGPEVLQIDKLGVDDPGPGQLLVEVAAAGLNRADLLQRRGHYPAPDGFFSDVPGLEFSGRVAAVGSGVGRFAPGDQVMGIVGGGAMATHLLVHEREVMPVPGSLDLAEAAAVPEAFLTAFDAFTQARLAPGNSVLIHAAPSGVGTAAVQLAHRFGALPLGTSRSRHKLRKCEALGLTHSIEVSGDSPTFVDTVKEICPQGVNVVLDFVGAAYLEQNLKSLALRGRLVVLGLLGGANGDIPLGLILRKRITMIGSVLRSRPLEEKADLTQRFAASMLAFLEDGSLKPVVHSIMPMTEVQQAHAVMERNENVGKIVLRWSS